MKAAPPLPLLPHQAAPNQIQTLILPLEIPGEAGAEELQWDTGALHSA